MVLTLCYELTRFISHPKVLLATQGREERERERETAKGRERAGMNVEGRP